MKNITGYQDLNGGHTRPHSDYIKYNNIIRILNARYNLYITDLSTIITEIPYELVYFVNIIKSKLVVPIWFGNNFVY